MAIIKIDNNLISDILLNRLYRYASKISGINQELKNYELGFSKNYSELELRKIKKKLKDLKYNFGTDMERLYTTSVNDNYLWQFCPSIVYEENFENIIKDFKNEHPDGSLTMLISDEIREIEKYQEQVYFLKDAEFYHDENATKNVFIFYTNRGKFVLDFLSKELDYNISLTQSKKIKFLQSKLNHTGKEQPDPKENNISDIFTPEKKSYCIFTFLKEKLNDSQRDYAYIFRKLQEKGYILQYIKPEHFQEWLYEETKKEIDHRNKKYHLLGELGEKRKVLFDLAVKECNLKDNIIQ